MCALVIILMTVASGVNYKGVQHVFHQDLGNVCECVVCGHTELSQDSPAGMLHPDCAVLGRILLTVLCWAGSS